MSTGNLKAQPKPSASARAEAAAWLARLHGPNRSPEVEAGFRRWLAEAPEGAAAFELLTDTWEKSARLRRRPVEQRAERSGLRISLPRAALAAAAVAIVAIVGTMLYLQNDALITQVGEQRIVRLEDGSRVHLNTDTRIVVHYDKQRRGIELQKGEASFDVAPQTDRVFVVTVGDRQVRAIGTSFMIRRDERNLAVTLVEGKVTVAPTEGNSAGYAPASDAAVTSTGATIWSGSPDAILLTAGERLTMKVGEPARIDRPSLDQVSAWQRGQVAFDDTPLVDALAEMNRYSDTQLAVADSISPGIRVSGVFKAGDSIDFARAIASTYRLQVQTRSRQLVLSAGDNRPDA